MVIGICLPHWDLGDCCVCGWWAVSRCCVTLLSHVAVSRCWVTLLCHVVAGDSACQHTSTPLIIHWLKYEYVCSHFNGNFGDFTRNSNLMVDLGNSMLISEHWANRDLLFYTSDWCQSYVNSYTDSSKRTDACHNSGPVSQKIFLTVLKLSSWQPE